MTTAWAKKTWTIIRSSYLLHVMRWEGEVISLLSGIFWVSPYVKYSLHNSDKSYHTAPQIPINSSMIFNYCTKLPPSKFTINVNYEICSSAGIQRVYVHYCRSFSYYSSLSCDSFINQLYFTNWMTYNEQATKSKQHNCQLQSYTPSIHCRVSARLDESCNGLSDPAVYQNALRW